MVPFFYDVHVCFVPIIWAMCRFALFPFLVYWEGCTKTVIYLYLFYPVLRTADVHGTFFLVFDEEEKLDRGVLLATWHDG